jgi:endoglucanase
MKLGVGLLACSLALAAIWPGRKPKLELHTNGNRIVDAHNRPVRLCGINWYGFETKFFIPHGIWSRDYKYLLDAIKANGFNSIRLPFSDETIQSDPKPTKISFENGNNADLHDLTAMQIMDKIVAYANKLGLYIIFDNHRSEAGDSAESSGLWYNMVYPESTWLQDWQAIAHRYKDVPVVIGMDLRNEPHNAHIGGSCWTGDETSLVPGCPESDTKHNWPMAATRAANALLAINPKWLIFIEGVDEYSHAWYWNGGNFIGARQHPIVLKLKNKLVYSPHEYGPRLYHQSWFNASTTPGKLNEVRRKFWSYLNEENIAPVWIGEFGTQNKPDRVTSDVPGSQGQWFSNFMEYMQDHPEVNWAYWALNGTDGDGLLPTNYDATPASAEKIGLLRKVQK